MCHIAAHQQGVIKMFWWDSLLERSSVVNLFYPIVYRTPDPYSEFLFQFSLFQSTLVLKKYSKIISGDFDIHLDIDNGSLCIYFTIGHLHRVRVCSEVDAF